MRPTYLSGGKIRVMSCLILVVVVVKGKGKQILSILMIMRNFYICLANKTPVAVDLISSLDQYLAESSHYRGYRRRHKHVEATQVL